MAVENDSTQSVVYTGYQCFFRRSNFFVCIDKCGDDAEDETWLLTGSSRLVSLQNPLSKLCISQITQVSPNPTITYSCDSIGRAWHEQLLSADRCSIPRYY